MMRYALIAALCGVLVLSGTLYREMQETASLAAENAVLGRNIFTLEQERDHAHLAKRVARAAAARDRARAQQMDALVEELERMDLDAELPSDFVDWTDRLLWGDTAPPGAGSGQN